MSAPPLNKATRINLLDFHTPQMRAFHLTWFAFFLCFFAWFGIAPLMPMVKKELSLEPWMIGNLIIASVAATVFARLLIGWLCDRFGPRYCYTGLLIFGSIPVMGIGFADSYESLFWYRLAIGCIGASFVITQYHTTLMFAPNVVGTANATTAGWGNLGGGVTQQVMPLLAALFVWLGATTAFGWRAAMFCAGLAVFMTGIAYFFLTQDTPDGNFAQLRKEGRLPKPRQQAGAFGLALLDVRVWLLFIAYGACFGIELTINNMAATYFHERYELALWMAGLIAGLHGLLNIFARTLGGVFGDRWGKLYGLKGRVRWLFCCLFLEGIALMCFSQIDALWLAIPLLLVFSLFVQLGCGATYSVVPFINKNALGAVAGVVGAGGNVGAVLAGFLFKTETSFWPTALLILGGCVLGASVMSLLVKFSPEAEAAAKAELAALQQPAERPATVAVPSLEPAVS